MVLSIALQHFMQQCEQPKNALSTSLGRVQEAGQCLVSLICVLHKRRQQASMSVISMRGRETRSAW